MIGPDGVYLVDGWAKPTYPFSLAHIEGGHIGFDIQQGCTINHKARAIVLAGPTASPWPPTFFEHGVTVLGGIRILHPARMLQVVSEGGSGYFFEVEAEKVCLVREPLLVSPGHQGPG